MLTSGRINPPPTSAALPHVLVLRYRPSRYNSVRPFATNNTVKTESWLLQGTDLSVPTPARSSI
ncbi:MAG: hypothetical protein FWG87_00100 [Defluviitaleaceae bacterium]|nr:hypothetical protein [Defluviitaleaceae bacterium]